MNDALLMLGVVEEQEEEVQGIEDFEPNKIRSRWNTQEPFTQEQLNNICALTTIYDQQLKAHQLEVTASLDDAKHTFTKDYKHPCGNGIRANRNYLSLDAKYNSIDTKLFFAKQNELLTKYDFKLDKLVELAGDHETDDVYISGVDIKHQLEKYSEDDEFFSKLKLAYSTVEDNKPVFLPHVENQL